ncbi:MAG: hypothetical protein ACPG80_05500 [Rickettsiales bacterium]
MTAALLGRLFDGFETFEDRAVVEDCLKSILKSWKLGELERRI